ncbi:MAG: hypothetical protein AAGA21_04720 [Pseudomonadota bacterium]
MTRIVEKVQSPHADAERRRADLTWERIQEQAMQAFTAGNPSTARVSWEKALDIAERHFERGDPRIAASLSNHAYGLMRRGQTHQAGQYFRRAIAAWEDSWCWIPWMAPSTEPDGIEVAAYDRATQDAFYAMIEQGKAITETLWREGRLPEAVGDDWATVKPKSMTDIRRLFSAVFLMPTARSKRTGHHAA